MYFRISIFTDVCVTISPEGRNFNFGWVRSRDAFMNYNIVCSGIKKQVSTPKIQGIPREILFHVRKLIKTLKTVRNI